MLRQTHISESSTLVVPAPIQAKLSEAHTLPGHSSGVGAGDASTPPEVLICQKPRQNP